jgi:hypothetical protein
VTACFILVASCAVAPVKIVSGLLEFRSPAAEIRFRVERLTANWFVPVPDSNDVPLESLSRLLSELELAVLFSIWFIKFSVLRLLISEKSIVIFQHLHS